ncbi:MAG: DUF4375 domain-containing protein [Acidobacteria bacterium]|nr:DUF4375 domain-containing protein [Acidobacteriota bacterium]
MSDLFEEKVWQPALEVVNIYEDYEIFRKSFAGVPPNIGRAYAASFIGAEICNGGFSQLFYNSTGILVPEGIEGMRLLGMRQTADVVQKAVDQLGEPYPREREDRITRLEQLEKLQGKKTWWPFESEFYKLINAENGGFQKAAEKFAATVER